MFLICPSLWPEPAEGDKILLIQHIYACFAAAVRYTGMSRDTTSYMHTSIHTPHYFSHINIDPFVCFCNIKVDLALPTHRKHTGLPGTCADKQLRRSAMDATSALVCCRSSPSSPVAFRCTLTTTQSSWPFTCNQPCPAMRNRNYLDCHSCLLEWVGLFQPLLSVCMSMLEWVGLFQPLLSVCMSMLEWVRLFQPLLSVCMSMLEWVGLFQPLLSVCTSMFEWVGVFLPLLSVCMSMFEWFGFFRPLLSVCMSMLERVGFFQSHHSAHKECTLSFPSPQHVCVEGVGWGWGVCSRLFWL